MIQWVNKAQKGLLDTNKCQKIPGAKGNCSIFHSDDGVLNLAQCLKITIKTFSHISKGLITNIFNLILKKQKVG